MCKMQHAVDVKIDMIKRCLFAFVFENSNQRSMITEKLMHAHAPVFLWRRGESLGFWIVDFVKRRGGPNPSCTARYPTKHNE